jgi:transposase-like protein
MVAVALQGDQSIANVARSFDISESCLSRWLRIADREDAGLSSSSTRSAPPPANELESENRRCANGPSQLE